MDGLGDPALKILVSLAAVTVIACGILVALFMLGAPPSTRELDADLGRVREQVAAAEQERSKYEGGLLVNLIDLRIEALRTNEAFLQMKRDSLLRRIDLKYVVDGTAVTPNPDRIASIERDIASTTEDLEKARQEAAQYTGGMMQTMLIVQAATHEATLAQLNMSLMAERYGFVVKPGQSAADEPIGQTVVTEDGEAL